MLGKKPAKPKEQAKAKHELPPYPPDHALGMVVPKGGSACSKCEYVDGQNCKERHFIFWNSGPVIPAPVDEYCCDFFEPQPKYKGTSADPDAWTIKKDKV